MCLNQNTLKYYMKKMREKGMIEKIGSRASLKIHSYNLQPRFTSDFTLNLVNVARYTSQTQRKI